MYRESDINLLYRFIGLLLFLLTILFVNNIYFLIILFLSLFIFLRNNNPLLFLMIILTLLFLVLKIFDNSISIVNMVLVIDYIIIFFSNVKKSDFVLTKNIFFNKKFTYKDLSNSYQDVISKNNEDLFLEYVNKNNILETDDFNEIKDRLPLKNSSDVFNKLCVNYTRFYKNQNDRYKYLGFNRDTLIYLGFHVIVLIIGVIL